MLWWAIGAAMAQYVAPEGRALGLAMGEHWVPRDSMVRRVQAACPPGHQAIEVLTVDPWYRIKGVGVVTQGQQGCLQAEMLSEAPSGDPILETELRVAWEARFGSVDPETLQSTPWGRVALPMVRELSPSERRAVYLREGLVSPKQRDRAVVAEGPLRDGAPIYAHFLGTDAPRSDRWGTVSTVIRLVSLSDDWAKHCRHQLPATIPEANVDTCLVQIGDLGWYNDTLPDPLGHREHHAGTCADIRLFRNDASRYEAWWNRPDDRPGRPGGYSRALTQAFLAFAVETASPMVIHFNDPAVLAAVPQVTAARGHDDHIHMCF